MGFDYYCSIYLEGNLIKFLENLRDAILAEKSDEWKQNIPKLSEILNKLSDEDYFKDMVLNFENKDDWEIIMEIHDCNNDIIPEDSLTDEQIEECHEYFEYMTLERL